MFTVFVMLSHILRPVAASQILLPVICSVFVDVVNELTCLSVHHNPVKSDKALLTVIVITAHQVSIFVPIPDMAFNNG